MAVIAIDIIGFIRILNDCAMSTCFKAFSTFDAQIFINMQFFTTEYFPSNFKKNITHDTPSFL